MRVGVTSRSASMLSSKLYSGVNLTLLNSIKRLPLTV